MLTASNGRLDDINKHCLQEFRRHWECLDNNNQQLWQCRGAERQLNKCVFENLVRCLQRHFSKSSLIGVAETGKGYSWDAGRGDARASAEEADIRALLVLGIGQCILSMSLKDGAYPQWLS